MSPVSTSHFIFRLSKYVLPPLVVGGGSITHVATAEIKYVSGSVEAACGLGLADAVVDLVETGTTMRVSFSAAHNLVLRYFRFVIFQPFHSFFLADLYVYLTIRCLVLLPYLRLASPFATLPCPALPCPVPTCPVCRPVCCGYLIRPSACSD